MTKIMLDKAYAGRKPGDNIEATELEIDALVAIGIVRRPPVETEQYIQAEDDPAPKIPLNPPPSAEPSEDDDHHEGV